MGTQQSPSKHYRRQGSLQTRTLPFYAISLALLLFLWIAASSFISGTPKRFLLPSPGEVFVRFTKLLSSGALLRHTWVTLTEMGLGLLLGTLTAVLLGYSVAHNRVLAYLLEPVIVTSQAVPIVALAPLLTVWFGPGLPSKVVVCALIVFFPILVNVAVGLKSIDPRLRDLFQMLEASPRDVLLKLEVPAALPSFLAGLKVGGTLAGMGAVVGEFVASSAGLGYLVKQGQNLYDMPMMFVAIITLMIIALTIYGGLSLLEQALHQQQERDLTTVDERRPTQ